MYVCIYVCMCVYDSVIPIYTETQFSKQLSYDEEQIKLLHMGLGSNLSPGVATDFQKAVSNHSTSKVNSNSIIYQKNGLFLLNLIACYSVVRIWPGSICPALMAASRYRNPGAQGT